ncbi:alpha/beta hydrolase [bacterium]|nr:alpha/beta hydrolase [bacterium]
MKPVAAALASRAGVLEPLQSADSVEGQIQELKAVFESEGGRPMILIGHSWGAWLCLLFAARHPSAVLRLVLVGCAPVEDKYAEQIMQTRMMRLNKKEQAEFRSVLAQLSCAANSAGPALPEKLMMLINRTDTHDPEPGEPGDLMFRAGIYEKVWPEAQFLRRSGALMEALRSIRCPVLAVHGDYDPHPYAGVRDPLSAVLKDFRFILLEKCGHRPWIEKQASERFYRILTGEIVL